MNLALIPLWPFLPRGTLLYVREANTLSAELPTYRRPRLLGAAYRALYPRADCIICPAHAMAEDLVEHFGIPRASIRHIPNPVDADEIRALSQGPSPFIGPGPHFLGAGRLAPQKGFDLMVDAFARLAARLPEAQLWVLGEGEGRASLEEQAERLGLASRVHVVGHVPNPYVWMRHASAFVLSSRYEGLPNVVLEAIACGAPVAAFDCPGGTREILERIGGQVLVPAGDVGALAEAMECQARAERQPADLPEEYRLPNVVRAYADLFCAPRAGDRVRA
jgi:glycosyltransferase involved in cell wall biosynthesis